MARLAAEFTGTITLEIFVFDNTTFITHIFHLDTADFVGVSEATRLAAGITSKTDTIYTAAFDLTSQNVIIPENGIWMAQTTGSFDYNGNGNDFLGVWHYTEIV